MPRTTIRTDDITNAQVKTEDMAIDPTNATNLSSGDVPLAQLDNVPATDLSPVDDDIAVLGFQVAAANDLAKYSLRDQIVDTFQDATGVDASASTNEQRDAAGKYYKGVVSTAGNATGGTETSYTSGPTTYKVHSFLANGNFVVPSSANVDALVVAGGGGSVGGGSQAHASGGGAGGMRTSAAHAVTAQTYAIVIGAGGVAASYGSMSTDADGGPMQGSDSSFDTITSAGGGRGGQGYSGTDIRQQGIAGGSGGGGGDGDGPAGAGNTPSTSPSQGNPGGAAAGTHGSSHIGSGGGGGKGATGGAGSGSHPNYNGGDGGVGETNDYRTGSAVYYCGGGGGSQSNPTNTSPGTEGTGGQGGGGNACRDIGTTADGSGGTANSGGGAGGGGYDGGSGIVVIRYVNNSFSVESPGNLTLVSTATTAEAGTTSTGDLVILYTPETGSTVLGTNLKAYVSRDDGTTYTQATLVGKGSYSGTTEIASVHDLDISAQPAGTSMRWKIETLVQSAALITRINGVSLGWA